MIYPLSSLTFFVLNESASSLNLGLGSDDGGGNFGVAKCGADNPERDPGAVEEPRGRGVDVTSIVLFDEGENSTIKF